MTGNVDADKVIMRENLMLAGDYDRIGNWTKDKNGTATKEVSGKSVAAILKDLTSKTLQPTITANPSINGFGLSGAGAVEAGTPVATASYLAASLNPGSYKYGPKTGTGVVASNWKVERITDGGAEQWHPWMPRPCLLAATTTAATASSSATLAALTLWQA